MKFKRVYTYEDLCRTTLARWKMYWRHYKANENSMPNPLSLTTSNNLMRFAAGFYDAPEQLPYKEVIQRLLTNEKSSIKVLNDRVESLIAEHPYSADVTPLTESIKKLQAEAAIKPLSPEDETELNRLSRRLQRAKADREKLKMKLRQLTMGSQVRLWKEFTELVEKIVAQQVNRQGKTLDIDTREELGSQAMLKYISPDEEGLSPMVKAALTFKHGVSTKANDANSYIAWTIGRLNNLVRKTIFDHHEAVAKGPSVSMDAETPGASGDGSHTISDVVGDPDSNPADIYERNILNKIAEQIQEIKLQAAKSQGLKKNRLLSKIKPLQNLAKRIMEERNAPEVPRSMLPAGNTPSEEPVQGAGMGTEDPHYKKYLEDTTDTDFQEIVRHIFPVARYPERYPDENGKQKTNPVKKLVEQNPQLLKLLPWLIRKMQTEDDINGTDRASAWAKLSHLVLFTAFKVHDQWQKSALSQDGGKGFSRKMAVPQWREMMLQAAQADPVISQSEDFDSIKAFIESLTEEKEEDDDTETTFTELSKRLDIYLRGAAYDRARLNLGIKKWWDVTDEQCEEIAEDVFERYYADNQRFFYGYSENSTDTPRGFNRKTLTPQDIQRYILDEVKRVREAYLKTAQDNPALHKSQQPRRQPGDPPVWGKENIPFWPTTLPVGHEHLRPNPGDKKAPKSLPPTSTSPQSPLAEGDLEAEANSHFVRMILSFTDHLDRNGLYRQADEIMQMLRKG